MPEAIARHLRVAADGHLHLFFMLLLFEKKIGDRMTGLLVADDDELPGLTVASRRRPTGAVENLSNHLIGNISCLIVSTDTSPAAG